MGQHDPAEVARRLRTVSAIPVTPFGSDGKLDEPVYAGLVERLVGAGVNVVTAGGNTGEFYALSAAERDRVAELTVEAAGDALVIAGVGLDLATATAAARGAVRAGAQAVMVHQPVHPFRTAQGWVDYHRAIADAVPGAGVVPYVRDPLVTAAWLGELLERCPNVVGVKYAIADPARFAATVRALPTDRVTWICGLAEGWAPFFWPAGASGFTSGLVTVHPELSLGLLRALEDGTDTGALWAQAQPFEELRARDASALNVSVVKEALAQLGLCSRDVRPPISTLGSDDRERVRQILAGWGLAPA
jgi:4-hydroxy-tetrahydrodipicolinate synthase